MNKYNTLAQTVDFIHVLVIIFWAGGFLVPKSDYPDFRQFHSTFGVIMFTIQLIFSLRCPLTLVSGHLRELANPGFTKNRFYRPFLVTLLRERFGISVPATLITIIAFIGTGLMTVTLISVS